MTYGYVRDSQLTLVISSWILSGGRDGVNGFLKGHMMNPQGDPSPCDLGVCINLQVHKPIIKPWIPEAYSAEGKGPQNGFESWTRVTGPQGSHSR